MSVKQSNEMFLIRWRIMRIKSLSSFHFQMRTNLLLLYVFSILFFPLALSISDAHMITWKSLIHIRVIIATMRTTITVTVLIQMIVRSMILPDIMHNGHHHRRHHQHPKMFVDTMKVIS